MLLARDIKQSVYISNNTSRNRDVIRRHTSGNMCRSCSHVRSA